MIYLGCWQQEKDSRDGQIYIWMPRTWGERAEIMEGEKGKLWVVEDSARRKSSLTESLLGRAKKEAKTFCEH